jgi:hypothetical protein
MVKMNKNFLHYFETYFSNLNKVHPLYSNPSSKVLFYPPQQGCHSLPAFVCLAALAMMNYFLRVFILTGFPFKLIIKN